MARGNLGRSGGSNLSYNEPSKFTEEQKKQFSELFNQAATIIRGKPYASEELKVLFFQNCIKSSEKYQNYKDDLRYAIFPNENIKKDLKLALMKLCVTPDKWSVCKQKYEI